MARKQIPTGLMSEERVNWYLRQLDNPAFIMGLVRDGIWDAIKEKLVYSLRFYDIGIPDELQEEDKHAKNK